jgi:hypothetical protein
MTNDQNFRLFDNWEQERQGLSRVLWVLPHAGSS